MQLVADVDNDLQNSMNLLNFLRRLRMHGFALTTVFNPEERKFIASRAFCKPID